MEQVTHQLDQSLILEISKASKTNSWEEVSSTQAVWIRMPTRWKWCHKTARKFSHQGVSENCTRTYTVNKRMAGRVLLSRRTNSFKKSKTRELHLLRSKRDRVGVKTLVCSIHCSRSWMDLASIVTRNAWLDRTQATLQTLLRTLWLVSLSNPLRNLASRSSKAWWSNGVAQVNRLSKTALRAKASSISYSMRLSQLKTISKGNWSSKQLSIKPRTQFKFSKTHG